MIDDTKTFFRPTKARRRPAAKPAPVDLLTTTNGVVTFSVPWPPSINHYWRRMGRNTVLSQEGREYKTTVKTLMADRRDNRGNPIAFGRQALEVSIVLFPPDQRRRDIDNSVKSLLDALQYAKVFEDDGRIEDLRVRRSTTTPGGSARVTIGPFV